MALKIGGNTLSCIHMYMFFVHLRRKCSAKKITGERMATFTIETGAVKTDGTCKIYVRMTHNRRIKRIPTGVYVDKKDMTRGGKIKDMTVLNKCADIISQCREFCNRSGFDIAYMTVDELMEKVKSHLAGDERFRLDFIGYVEGLIEIQQLACFYDLFLIY
jgi:hypothetical protein